MLRVSLLVVHDDAGTRYSISSVSARLWPTGGSVLYFQPGLDLYFQLACAAREIQCCRFSLLSIYIFSLVSINTKYSVCTSFAYFVP